MQDTGFIAAAIGSVFTTHAAQVSLPFLKEGGALWLPRARSCGEPLGGLGSTQTFPLSRQLVAQVLFPATSHSLPLGDSDQGRDVWFRSGWFRNQHIAPGGWFLPQMLQNTCFAESATLVASTLLRLAMGLGALSGCHGS